MTDLFNTTLSCFPLGHPTRWSCLIPLAEIATHVQDWTTALELLREGIEFPTYHDTQEFLFTVSRVMSRIDSVSMSHQQQQNLLCLYGGALEFVTVVSGIAIDTDTRLRHIYEEGAMGRHPFMLAAHTSDLAVGLQLLEHARGVL